MSSNDSKIKINCHSILSLLFILIFLLTINISPVSAVSIDIVQGLQNYDIQTLIDGSHNGDTINFTGNIYQNISLVINKKLNIISDKNTKIIGSKGLMDPFTFYFTTNSSGSVLSGFNILTNADYGIIVENAKNINIDSNNISGGYNGTIMLNKDFNININNNNLSNSEGNGLDIEYSKKISVNKNHISNNQYSGIKINNSYDTNVTTNKVSNNNLSGLSVYSSKNITAKNNTIEKNGHGVYLSNTNKVKIYGNEINNNALNGITLEDTTENTYISYNNITQNLNGIYIDSYSVNDTIVSNNINNNTKLGFTYLSGFDTGNGIDVGNNYIETDPVLGQKINIKNNIITNNRLFSVKGNPQYEFTVGANWYGTNNPLDTGVCPMVQTGMCLVRLGKTSNGYAVGVYDGNTLDTQLPSMNVTFMLDGKTSQTVQLINGTALYTKHIDPSVGHTLSAIVGKDTLTYAVAAIVNNNPGSGGNPGGNPGGIWWQSWW